MAQARFSIASQHAGQFRDLAKALRAAGKKPGGELRKQLRTRITEAGKPVVEEVRSAVLAIPVTSHGGGSAQRSTHAALEAGRRAVKARGAPGKPRRTTTAQAIARAAARPHGLRESIARAVKLQITARGVRFIVNSSQLPESQRTLPRHLDSPKGWRHPVFANREHWVHQQGRPYFAATIKKRAVKFRQSIVQAMEDIKNKIERN
jgi:hypothetical protein